jgi:NhaA family Na+:H+ antiporter
MPLFAFANAGVPMALSGFGSPVTMALFIANLAFSQSLIDAAKLGIFLASVVSAVAGVALLAWLQPRECPQTIRR